MEHVYSRKYISNDKCSNSKSLGRGRYLYCYLPDGHNDGHKYKSVTIHRVVEGYTSLDGCTIVVCACGRKHKPKNKCPKLVSMRGWRN